jgi:hypothetical protein
MTSDAWIRAEWFAGTIDIELRMSLGETAHAIGRALSIRFREDLTCLLPGLLIAPARSSEQQ